MGLHVEVDHPGGGPRVVLVHGFTQTGRCWGSIGADLARDHEVVRVDAPGHGGSAEVAADLVAGGRLLAEAGGAGTYLGYSMGGRLALHGALAVPGAVQRLVLVGATGGIDDDTERAARRAADDALAARLGAIGVDAFLDEWLAQPLFEGLPSEARHLDERRRNTAAGLASSLRLAGTGTQAPLWDRLGELGRRGVRVLCVAGARDAKFAALAERLAAAIGPTAEVALVPGAGHTAHLEQPAAFLALLRPWLARTA